MGAKKWIIREQQRETGELLAEECDISPFLGLLLANRGISDPFYASEFLFNDSVMEDPFSLCDMDIAADRISQALEQNEKIAVYGDYDCDGVTATTLLYSYLKSRNADVIFYIPDRLSEGYGMNTDAVKKLAEQGVKLIITVDNGVNSTEEISLCTELMMDVVVTDHHLPQNSLPECCAVVDPHRSDDISECKCLAGVGVAFMLVCAIDGSPADELLCRYADIVTLGTIGDVVPLVGINRTICRIGIDMINENPSTGLCALIKVCGMGDKIFTSTSISFSLVPRINAAGRMGDASRAVNLFLAENIYSALPIAEELNNDNSERQKICDEIFREACEIIDRCNISANGVLVAAGDGWHHGIIGIVAARITERYGKPCILLCRDENVLRGSGRSVEGFNLFNAISYASSATITFGGHELAAGLTVGLDELDEFIRLINEYAEEQPPTYQSIVIDCKLKPDIICYELGELAAQLEPYGNSNAQPLFGLFGAEILRITPLKEGKYLKFTVKKDGVTVSFLCFSYSYELFPFVLGDNIDIAFTVECSSYNDRPQLNVTAKYVRTHGIDEDAFFSGLEMYDTLCNNSLFPEMAEMLPERDDFVKVFTFINKFQKPVTREMIINHLHSIGTGKLNVIITAFEQAGVLAFSNNTYTPANLSEKADLNKTEIIEKLKSIDTQV